MKTTLTIFIAAATLAISCKTGNNPSDKQDDSADLIKITASQFRNEKMAFGEFERKVFTEKIICNGNIVARPSGNARVSSKIPGQVVRILCSAGQKVRTGDTLFELSGNDIIELQKELSETASRFKRVSSEYNRIKALYGENVGSEKEVISAESEYNSAMAAYSALKLKIRNLGLDPGRIEKGDFYSSFPVRSPLNGSIAEINVTLGQFAEPQDLLAVIIDNSQLQLRLAVFEKDLAVIRPGQPVMFRPAEKSEYSEAKLASVGQSVDPESRTVTCIAEITDARGTAFINNGYAEAMIITSADTMNAVPDEAVLRSGGADYLLTLARMEDSTFFLNRVKVNALRRENGFREIAGTPALTGILTRGTYNIVLE